MRDEDRQGRWVMNYPLYYINCTNAQASILTRGLIPVLVRCQKRCTLYAQYHHSQFCIVIGNPIRELQHQWPELVNATIKFTSSCDPYQLFAKKLSCDRWNQMSERSNCNSPSYSNGVGWQRECDACGVACWRTCTSYWCDSWRRTGPVAVAMVSTGRSADYSRAISAPSPVRCHSLRIRTPASVAGHLRLMSCSQ